ncbi:hypothetical protein E4U41_007598 [Claviceps citrina]|nr:hypothetical protein E4U41_007598 [Claviceps citrina]
MPSLKAIALLLLAAISATAAAPAPAPACAHDTGAHTPVQTLPLPKQHHVTTTTTLLDVLLTTGTPAPSLGTSSGGETRSSCDYSFCDERGTRWCYYWRGITAYDVSEGVVPAETKVALGPCVGN